MANENKYLGWNEIGAAMFGVYGANRALQMLEQARRGQKLREDVAMSNDAERRIAAEINRAFTERTPEAEEFVRNLDWMANSLERHSEEDILALFHIRDKFTDGNVRTQLLRELGGYTKNGKTKVLIGRALAADPAATLRDMVSLYQAISNLGAIRMSDAERAQLPDEMRALNNDIIKRGQAEVDKIMASERPNVDALADVIRNVHASANNLERFVPSPETKALGKQIKSKFNMESILAADASDKYMAQYDKTLESQLVDAQSQVKSAQDMVGDRDARIAQMERELAEMKSKLEKMTTEIGTLRQENSELRATNESNRREMDGKLRTLKEAAAKMSAGVGSKGVNKFKEILDREIGNAR